jgi:hypothetical protein
MAPETVTRSILSIEDVADVLHYLSNVRPLEGCEFGPRFEAGRAFILEVCAESLRASGNATIISIGDSR